MKLGLATLAAFVALVAALPAHASTPIPWCGTSSSGVDRLPDATPAYAVHVAYVRTPGAPDRFAEFAPRIVGDTAAFDAWWRREDPTRTPRFDLFPAPGCASAFGALDISNVQLPNSIGGISVAFQQLRQQLSAEAGFDEAEKAYLVYFDGSTGQSGEERVCGQGARASFGLPGMAVVYLDSCDADEGDSLRPVVAVHELVHVFGAVERSAPSSCQSGHVCDFGLDLMTAILTGEELDEHVLDSARNDYYGHAGSWTDVQDSTFLERLDSPDRTPPTTAGRAPGRGRSDRLRPLLLAGVDGRRRPGRLPHLRGRRLRPADRDDLGAPARVGHDGALLGSRGGHGRTPERPGERALPTRRRDGRRAGPPDPRHRAAAGDRARHDQADAEGVRAHVAGRARCRGPALLPRQDRRQDAERAQADDHDRPRDGQRPGLDRGDRPRRQRRARRSSSRAPACADTVRNG